MRAVIVAVLQKYKQIPHYRLSSGSQATAERWNAAYIVIADAACANHKTISHMIIMQKIKIKKGDTMQEIKKEYDLAFAYCVYYGISNEIEFEIKNGTNDRTEELQYIVDRYNDEYIVSGHYLSEKLEEYKQAIKNR